jgi:hypothetical protein
VGEIFGGLVEVDELLEPVEGYTHGVYRVRS